MNQLDVYPIFQISKNNKIDSTKYTLFDVQFDPIPKMLTTAGITLKQLDKRFDILVIAILQSEYFGLRIDKVTSS